MLAAKDSTLFKVLFNVYVPEPKRRRLPAPVIEPDWVTSPPAFNVIIPADETPAPVAKKSVS